MSNTMKGLFGSLVVAASLVATNGPAQAETTLASLGLDRPVEECNLQLTRRALDLDLDIAANYRGVVDHFCGCRVVSVQMLQYIRKHRLFEVILRDTDQQCPGFARALSNVQTASTGNGGFGGSNGSHNWNDDDDHDRDRNGGGDNGGGGGGGNGGGGNGGGGNGTAAATTAAATTAAATTAAATTAAAITAAAATTMTTTASAGAAMTATGTAVAKPD